MGLPNVSGTARSVGSSSGLSDSITRYFSNMSTRAKKWFSNGSQNRPRYGRKDIPTDPSRPYPTESDMASSFQRQASGDTTVTDGVDEASRTADRLEAQRPSGSTGSDHLQPGYGTKPDGTPANKQTSTSGEKIAAREAITRSKLTDVNISTKTYLGGISLTGMMIYAGVIVDATDGEKATIINMQIDSSDNNYAIITYEKGNRPNFKPAEKDTITLSNTGLEQANDCIIVEVLGSTRIKVDISNIPLASRPARNAIIVSGSSRVPPPQSGTPPPPQPEFVCHSDFGNQLAGAFDDLASFAGDVAGTVIGAGIDLAGNAASRLLDEVADLAEDAGGAAGRILGAAGGAARQGFCATLPIMCDSTIWLIILIGVVAMIIFVAVS